MARAKSAVGGDDGIRFQEVEKGPRRRRGRPSSVMDDVETPREVEALDADRSQAPRIQLPLDAEPCGFRSENKTAPRRERTRRRSQALGLSNSPHRLRLRASLVPTRRVVLISGKATLGGGLGPLLHFAVVRRPSQ